MSNKVLVFAAVLMAGTAAAAEIYVSPNGNDANRGTRSRPLRTFQAAQRAARKLTPRAPVTVWFRGGTYYLPDTVVFTEQDSGSAHAPVVYSSVPGEEAVISGGSRLQLAWTPYRDGIMQARVPAGLDTDQLFVNGQRQHMARYPNYDPAAGILDGWSPDAFSKERAARWKDPRGGFIHALHRSLWGSHHYIITGKDADGAVTYEGGWQMGREGGPHEKYRFVENIFEELDAPGEWFLNKGTSTLYFYPPAGLNLTNAAVEVVRLRHLIEFRGTEQHPVKWVRLQSLTFRHSARTFMETREPLLRSDWTIYRGGAILLEGAEDCAVEACFLDQVGGNAIFVNGYNRRIAVRRCHIAEAGASGVAFVGLSKAARSNPPTRDERLTFDQIDRTPGPKTNDYPADCIVEDSLIYRTGRVEKQTAPVQISMSQGITVRHCSLYDVPRAGINISEGTWSGHLIEFNDVFDTVKETGDHGSFNSWGRDRYWNLQGVDLNTVTLTDNRDLPRLDAMKPTVIRNNRWRCDHGWDVDLDDGSTNYHIYNNLFLNGGLKLREGFYRIVENNIMVNNSLHPHVWYGNSQDTFRHNIVFTLYRPIRVNKPWGRECDFNLLHTPGKMDPAPAGVLQQQSGLDQSSLEADALFIDSVHGDYRVKDNSPALKLGFRNFPMDQFGVQDPKLRAIARKPEMPAVGAPPPATLVSNRDSRTASWLGALVRNVVGLGEVSAGGLPGETGVLVLEVPVGSRAQQAGLRSGDLILKMDGKDVETLADLLQLGTAAHGGSKLAVLRQHRDIELEFDGPVW